MLIIGLRVVLIGTLCHCCRTRWLPAQTSIPRLRTGSCAWVCRRCRWAGGRVNRVGREPGDCRQLRSSLHTALLVPCCTRNS